MRAYTASILVDTTVFSQRGFPSPFIITSSFFDNKKHNLPHIDAQYAEHEAIIGIDDGEILEGSLPKPKMRLVQAWIEIHRDDLLANWKMAVEGQQPFKIDPLR